MALEWPPRIFINVDNFPFGIAWEVNADIDIDFCHLLINLCLHQVSVPYVFSTSLDVPFSLAWTS